MRVHGRKKSSRKDSFEFLKIWKKIHLKYKCREHLSCINTNPKTSCVTTENLNTIGIWKVYFMTKNQSVSSMHSFNHIKTSKYITEVLNNKACLTIFNCPLYSCIITTTTYR